MITRLPLPLLMVAIAIGTGSCGGPPRAGPTIVSVIERVGESGGGGGGAALEDAVRGATGRGLVRLDATGQVTPDLAARWAIVDNGLDYIFRIEDGVSPRIVAQRLRARLAARRNGLRAWFAPIATIEAVTATVIDVRLTRPMPDLLALLARPEMVLPGFPGAMRVRSRAAGRATLAAAPGEAGEKLPASIDVRGEPVGRAVARFAAGRSDVVIGGTFGDLAVAHAAGLAEGALRRDPASGLFGFAPRAPIDPVLLRALGLAIDRDRIAALVGGGGPKATTIAGSTIEPPLADRIATARGLNIAPRTIRVAMPDGASARLLFALIAQDWRRIGIDAVAVAPTAPADMALVDLVVPPGELARIACTISAGCDARDPIALLTPPFVPVMAPLRWSLVARHVDRFAENGLATHPLDTLYTIR